MQCLRSLGVEIVMCIFLGYKLQWCKCKTDGDVTGKFFTTKAGVHVMERPADGPEMCRMSRDCCSDDIQRKEGDDAAYYLQGFG